jgi:protein-tyrosine phosphatase
MAAAERRGISLESIRARRVEPDDYERFNFIIAMDQDNLAILEEQADEGYRDKLWPDGLRARSRPC